MNGVFGGNPEDAGAPGRSRPFRSIRVWALILSVVCLLGIGVYLFMAKEKSLDARAAAKPAAPAVSVTAAAAKKSDIGVYVTGLGSVVPLNTVTVKSRVDGQLMRVLFREGQTVKVGELLAEIDPRPFQVQLTQAQGQMARDQALLKNAHLDLDRYQVLTEQDSIAKQQYDTQKSLVRQYEGAVEIDQGQIDSARLQLAYCRITAPLGGRTGLRLVDQGNMVHAADTTGLVVITQLQPITVVFPIPEDSLPQVLDRLRSGARLAVEVLDREQRNRLATGYLLTVDNQIDQTTGTVRLKAEFPNTDNRLFPNQFVNVRLLVEVRHDSVIIPAAAIQRGPQGAYVYVVKADRTVTVRKVTPGVTEQGDTSISAGLAAGESVVVEGTDKLREGSRVALRGQGAGPGQRRAR
jgi:multidrug efflux system membrane fusion protein